MKPVLEQHRRHLPANLHPFFPEVQLAIRPTSQPVDSSNNHSQTLCFYGCATSKTHRAINYPIILSGGKNLGFRHGSHLSYSDDIPLSNLFVTIANQLSSPTESFADSTADISEVVG